MSRLTITCELRISANGSSLLGFSIFGFVGPKSLGKGSVQESRWGTMGARGWVLVEPRRKRPLCAGFEARWLIPARDLTLQTYPSRRTRICGWRLGSHVGEGAPTLPLRVRLLIEPRGTELATSFRLVRRCASSAGCDRRLDARFPPTRKAHPPPSRALQGVGERLGVCHRHARTLAEIR